MIDLRNTYMVDAPRAKGAYLDKLPKEAIDNPDWVLEVKEDGFRMTMQIEEHGSILLGRNRKKDGKFQSLVGCNPDIAKISSQRLAGTILDGELTEILNLDGSPSRDTLHRQKQGIFCGYTVWGCLFWKGRDVRHLAENRRYALAKRAVEILNCSKIRIAERRPLTMENIRRIWNQGLEGGIAKHLRKPIPVGQKTMPWWYKLKTEITVDAFISGVTQGKEGGSEVKGIQAHPNGKAASFTMSMYGPSGDVIDVCKLKLADGELKDMRDNGWKHFSRYKGRVVEMTVSGWNGKSFRWPKFLKFRDDKEPHDCLFVEQVGYGCINNEN